MLSVWNPYLDWKLFQVSVVSKVMPPSFLLVTAIYTHSLSHSHVPTLLHRLLLRILFDRLNLYCKYLNISTSGWTITNRMGLWNDGFYLGHCYPQMAFFPEARLRGMWVIQSVRISRYDAHRCGMNIPHVSTCFIVADDAYISNWIF